MLIQEKIGCIGAFEVRGRDVDVLELEWYETGKRIMRKRTRAGKEMAMRFLRESPGLKEGDILYADERMVIVVEIIPCEALVLRMGTMEVVASVCYETGNRHLPLFISDGELLVPFEEPLYRWLVAGGYDVCKEERKLLYPLKSTVAGHVHSTGGGLLAKILGV
jgi:urease accessory protein